MTGTEEIRINDRQYTEHISRILRQRMKVARLCATCTTLQSCLYYSVSLAIS